MTGIPEANLSGGFDASLVRRLQSGDAHAFEILVRSQTAPMLRLARRLMRSEEEARDAVQDAFVSVFRSIRNFEGGAQLTTWLHRVVINSCLMRLRRDSRRSEEDIEQYLPRFLEDGHQVTPSLRWCEPPDSALQRAELCEVVRSCIDRLPEEYRVVLLLRDIEELSTEDAAEALGISKAAVKSRLHRARVALRMQLDPYMRKGAR